MIHDLDRNQEVVIVNLLDVLARHNDRLLVCRFLHCNKPLAGWHMVAVSHLSSSEYILISIDLFPCPKFHCSVRLTSCCSASCPGTNSGKGTLEIVHIALWRKNPFDMYRKQMAGRSHQMGFPPGPVAQSSVPLPEFLPGLTACHGHETRSLPEGASCTSHLLLRPMFRT